MSHSLFRKNLLLSEPDFQQLLSRLQQKPSFIILDSANAEQGAKAFSLCVWQPSVLFKTTGNLTQIIKQDGESKTSLEDPLELINQELEKLTVDSSEDLPFCGGALGYWGYELGGRFEAMPQPKPHDITLPDMFVGIYHSGIIFNHSNDQIEFFSQSQTANKDFVELQALIAEIASTTSKEKLEAKFELTSPWLSNMTFADYQHKFGKVKSYLASGDCYQINLAQRFDANYSGCEWQAYLALRASNKAPFSSFIRLEEGAVLSLSPERFLQVKNREVETKPIKGTRPRSNNHLLDEQMSMDLATAEKDRAENLMIVDLLRNDIAKVSKPGTVKVPKIFEIESYPAVHHLVSTITSTLKDSASSLDLLRGAFPGGSITGAPKISAMRIIHELEPHPRSVYCGSVGYIRPNGDMDTNITIRTLVCNNNKIYCWAGGGLVADSVCEDEYQETLDKVNKILPILNNLKND